MLIGRVQQPERREKGSGKVGGKSLKYRQQEAAQAASVKRMGRGLCRHVFSGFCSISKVGGKWRRFWS